MRGKNAHMSSHFSHLLQRAVPDLTVLSTALHTATNNQLGLASELELATPAQMVSTSTS